MAAQTRDEIQRKKRRQRLFRGLVVGGAAIGLPALVNTLVSKRARRLEAPRWGGGETFSWKNGEVVFRRLGSGPPVVLVHSFGPGHSSAEWRRAAEVLARDYTVYAPDLLGWGESEKPSITYDGELYIELLAAFLKRQVGERSVVVAAGLPAAYAAQLAGDQPEWFRALGLITPMGIELYGDEPDFKDAVVHRLLRLPVLGTSALNVFTSRSGITNHLEREVYARGSKVDDALVDQHYRNSHQPGAHGALAAYLSGYLNHSVRSALGQIDLPVWIGWGRLARSPRVESADLWLKRLPGAELEVFEGCGILPHAEAPAEVATKLGGFLAELGNGPASA